MNFQLTYRHDKASDSLKESLKRDTEKFEKFSDKITNCHVIIDKAGHNKTVEIIITANGKIIKSLSKNENLGKAVDSAIEKSERQLKKMNEKMKNHKAPKSNEMLDSGSC